MPNTRAVVLGEALVDIVVPVAGSPREIPGGSPANVALTLGRLGRQVELVTWLGTDSRGRIVESHLTESNVVLAPGSAAAERTSTAKATLDPQGAASYNFDLDWQLPPVSLDETILIAHSGSIATTLEPGGTQVLETLRAARSYATITYDPNARPTIMGDAEEAYQRVLELLEIADVVKVSDEDIDWFTAGTPYSQVARHWLSLGVSLVIVTRGGSGAVAFTRQGEWDYPAVPVEVADTVGAGDSFMGAVIDSLWSLGLLGAANRSELAAITSQQVEAVMNHARRVSAVTVSRTGANPPWVNELNEVN